MGEAAGPGWVHQVGLLPKGKLDIPQVAAGWQPGDTDSQEGWEPEVQAGWAGRGGDRKVCGPVTGMLPGSHQAGASLCQAAFQGEGGQPKEKLAGMFSRNKNGLESTKLQNARVQIPSKPPAQGGTQGLQREGGRAQAVGELRLRGNISSIHTRGLPGTQPALGRGV